MPITQHTCAECGATFERYTAPSSRVPKVCSLKCNGARGAREHKSPWLTELNKRRNAELSRATAGKRREVLLDRGEGKTYRKHYGRHEHRVVAEAKLGRRLLPNEIVHHIDGDRRNNHPDNLQVMSRADHARLHALELTPDRRARKLCWKDVREMRAMRSRGDSQQSIADFFDVAQSLVGRIVRGEAWKE